MHQNVACGYSGLSDRYITIIVLLLLTRTIKVTDYLHVTCGRKVNIWLVFW